VRRKVVIPNRRYSWMMFERPADIEPVDAVVSDVNLAQPLEIDRSLAETFENTLLLWGFGASRFGGSVAAHHGLRSQLKAPKMTILWPRCLQQFRTEQTKLKRIKP